MLAIFVIHMIARRCEFAPWAPSSRGVAQQAFELAKLSSGERFVDLGSGDGRVVIAAAKLGCVATGIEISPLMCTIARANAWIHRSPARFVCQDLSDYDLSDTDVIYVFASPRGLREKLRAKAEMEMKPGSRLVTCTYPMEGWKATEILEGRRWHTLHLYGR